MDIKYVLLLNDVKKPNIIGTESLFFVVEFLFKYGTINECTVNYFNTEKEMIEFFNSYHFDNLVEPDADDFDSNSEYKFALENYKYHTEGGNKWDMELYNSKNEVKKGRLDL